MDIDADELQRCHVMYANVHEMLADRGYAVDARNASMTLQEFRERFGQHPNRRQMTIALAGTTTATAAATSTTAPAPAATAGDDERGPIVVLFPNEPKVGVGSIRELVKLMCDMDAQDAILVVQRGLTPAAGAVLRQLAPQLRVQMFLEQEMLCMSAIRHHELQPQFTVLGRQQKAAVLERYRCKEAQLPRMQAMDPIARYYGLRRGQVVKIVRASETAGRYTLYRCVA